MLSSWHVQCVPQCWPGSCPCYQHWLQDILFEVILDIIGQKCFKLYPKYSPLISWALINIGHYCNKFYNNNSKFSKEQNLSGQNCHKHISINVFFCQIVFVLSLSSTVRSDRIVKNQSWRHRVKIIAISFLFITNVPGIFFSFIENQAVCICHVCQIRFRFLQKCMKIVTENIINSLTSSLMQLKQH